MKETIAILFVLLLLNGCAAFEEAYYVDREFGMSSQALFDLQIAYSEQHTVTDPPEGLMGIDAEKMMATHNGAFGKPSKETNVFNISLTK